MVIMYCFWTEYIEYLNLFYYLVKLATKATLYYCSYLQSIYFIVVVRKLRAHERNCVVSRITISCAVQCSDRRVVEILIETKLAVRILSMYSYTCLLYFLPARDQRNVFDMLI